MIPIDDDNPVYYFILSSFSYSVEEIFEIYKQFCEAYFPPGPFLI